MKIVRAPQRSQYLQVPNATVRDQSITRRARGLLVELLSYPDGWSTDSRDLAETGPEGRDAIRAAIRELEGARYMIRTISRDDAGRFTTVVAVYDTPQHGQPEPVREHHGPPVPPAAPTVPAAPADAASGAPATLGAGPVASPQANDITAGQTRDWKPVTGLTRNDAPESQAAAMTGFQAPVHQAPVSQAPSSKTVTKSPPPPVTSAQLQSKSGQEQRDPGAAPDPASERTAEVLAAASGDCLRHGAQPVLGCRGCATTERQVADRHRRERTLATLAAAAAARAAVRAADAALAGAASGPASPARAAVLAAARAAGASARERVHQGRRQALGLPAATRRLREPQATPGAPETVGVAQ